MGERVGEQAHRRESRQVNLAQEIHGRCGEI